MTLEDLQKQIDAQQIIVSEKFAAHQTAKVIFQSAKVDWDSSVSDLKDLNTQLNVLGNAK